MDTCFDYQPRAPVTADEWELAGLMCAGLTTVRIAAELSIPLDGGIAGIASLMGKLGLTSRAQLAAVTAGGPADAEGTPG